MPVQMRGKRIGVEKLGKSSNQNTLFAMPEDTHSCGIVVFVGDALSDSDIKVGKKVYFGDRRQMIRIEGKEVHVMDEDNVLAIAQE